MYAIIKLDSYYKSKCYCYIHGKVYYTMWRIYNYLEGSNHVIIHRSIKIQCYIFSDPHYLLTFQTKLKNFLWTLAFRKLLKCLSSKWLWGYLLTLHYSHWKQCSFLTSVFSSESQLVCWFHNKNSWKARTLYVQTHQPSHMQLHTCKSLW